MVLTLHNGWINGAINIEVAFLEAILKEETWIEIPDGFEFAFGGINWTMNILFLKKAMYGLVQAP